jgi:hypothetical protein
MANGLGLFPKARAFGLAKGALKQSVLFHDRRDGFGSSFKQKTLAQDLLYRI